MNDVIQIFKFPSGEFFIQESSDLKRLNVFASLDDAKEVLGDGVSLELITVCSHKSEKQFIKVYLSKHATCCVLAEKYTQRRSI